MEDPELRVLEAVPENRAQAWFRVLLWLMPAVFGVASVFGLDWLQRKIGDSLVWITIWWVLNPAFIIATGWFNAVLSVPSSDGNRRILHRVAVFFLIQMILTPSLWYVALVVSLKCGWITFE